jgi:dipeptidyl aminopeptidase/acylaminoacyl peptidase
MRNGNYFTFTAEVYNECDTLECTAKKEAERKSQTYDVYTKLYVRHWDRWEVEGRYHHVFIAFSNTRDYSKPVDFKIVDVMKGMKANCPIYPFGGAEQYDISPDGQEIAVNAELDTFDVSWKTGWKIFTIHVNINDKSVGNPVSITDFTEARTQNPLYSPNGTLIAFLSMERPGYEADKLTLTLFNRNTKQYQFITKNWDRSIDGMVWSPSGRTMIVTIEEDAEHKVYAVDLYKRYSNVLINEGGNSGIIHVSGNVFALSRAFWTSPSDIYSFQYDEAQMTIRDLVQLTNYNKDLLSEYHMDTPSKFYFRGANGDRVQAWLFKPIDFNPSKKYPVVNLIHGGPQGAYSNGWSYRWNPQLWVSHGYAVYAINFHGSTGFGQAFTDSVRGNWGGSPFIDIMNGTDALLRQYSWLDGDRIGCAGASYGGYMINWIAGQTDRFKALVNHDGTFDSISKYFVTEELFFQEWEFYGTPWENPKFYDMWTPRRFVEKWKTPMLILHGGYDFRVPLSEGMATFTALQRRGIPSRLVYFPTENHWVLDPENGIEWYRNVLEWLDTYLKK